MICKKLTEDERLNMDVIGWSSILTRSEREFTSHCFDNLDLETHGVHYKDVINVDLYRIVVDEKEIGRFAIRKYDTGDAGLFGLFIYNQYRNKGYFKQVLNEIIETYKSITLYTSNKHMIAYLFKDPRFISNGWLPLSFCDNIDIRFETVKE